MVNFLNINLKVLSFYKKPENERKTDKSKITVEDF